MPAFNHSGDSFCIEGVKASDIAAAVGTPAYCYSTAQLRQNFSAFADAFAREMPQHDVTVCFACKSNGNIAVLKTLQKLGAGADIVSGGEMKRALAAGIPAGRIVFSGVGKTAAELQMALEQDILQINVESAEELELLSSLAARTGKKARIALRVNPDVDAQTHAKITTGKKENKFGIDIDAAPALYARAAKMQGIEVTGVAVHIGSQLTDLAPFRAAFSRIADLARAVESETGIAFSVFDLGGGIGISYDGEVPPDLADYARVVRETIGGFRARIVLEPGRAVSGNAGVLLSRVIRVKQGTDKKFLIIDAAMNDLLRPALYDAHHRIVPCVAGQGAERYDVVGPVCETGDTFLKNTTLPDLREGDLVAILNSGAYGAVMASTYNARTLAPEVLVSGDDFAVTRPALEPDDLLSRETVPDFLS